MSYVVINAIQVPEAMGTELEKRFAARAGAVDNQEGFVGFKLLRPAAGADAYYVFTEWESKENFEAWRDSQEFEHGHAQTQKQGPVGTDSNVLEFEVVDL